MEAFSYFSPSIVIEPNQVKFIMVSSWMASLHVEGARWKTTIANVNTAVDLSRYVYSKIL
jgi:hypothetical protein